MKEAVISETKKKMDKAIDSFVHELASLRTGRATPAIFDQIKVDYYGTMTPLRQVATFSVPESRLITIAPFDPSQIQKMEKAILASDLGLTPTSDGKVIRISLPPLTEERRKELVKVARKYAEECRVAVRNLRRDANEVLKKIEKDKKMSQDELKKAQEEVQHVTDGHTKKVDDILKKKEDEIMEV